MVTADELAETLGMQRHPEGGRYVETWRGPDIGGRATASAIYFLLVAGERSHWHRVDADEVWLFHAGDPLALDVAASAGADVARHVLGSSLSDGERPRSSVLIRSGLPTPAGAALCCSPERQSAPTASSKAL